MSMQAPLKVTLRNVAHSDALDALIRERAAKLEHFHPRLVGCRVVLELDGRHKHEGRQFVVRIDLKVPGGEIAVDHQHHEDLHVALREAFDAARRKLEDRVREQRGDVKRHSLPLT